MKIINIANDYTDSPGGRFRTDGDYSGEDFRETILVPSFESGEDLLIDLDGTYGCATSFLEEAFGGLARKYSTKEVLSRIKFKSEEEPHLIAEITKYIKHAND
jgi:hypothetical protein